jgi:uncharacterized protein (DUF2164 family)
MQMTLRKTQAALREHGLVLTKKDGEYRVNFYKGREGTAYYTNDLHDAALTGLAMVRERAAMQGSRRRSSRHADSRTGTPMYRSPQHATMWVSIEYLDGRKPRFVQWRGRSGKSIQKAARAKYKGIARLSFGRVMYHHGRP